MANTQWIVHKFGGTSVADAERYKNVALILESEPGARKAVVVSAMAKVTDSLIELLDLAKKKDETYLSKLEAVRERHLETIRALADEPARSKLEQAIRSDCANIQDLLRAVFLSRSYSEQTMELIAGHGELWSAQMLEAYLKSQGKNARWLDARAVLTVSPGETGPMVDWEKSKPRFQGWVNENPCDLLVITGYVASTPDGIATTLKRNGSDFSASIFGALADASSIVIWTDVDGVLSADPRRVPEAVVLGDMSYNEAMELAYFGAKVIHPHTMAPALEHGIPIWIRNTFNPKARGTRIHHRSGGGSIVKGFTTVDKVAMINLEGTGMIGVPGVANRLFGALKEVGVSVIMISQASSEHSICFAVPEAQGELAKKTVEQAFFAEIHHGQIQTVELSRDVSILAAVGDRMAQARGVAAQFFGSLSRSGVNIRAIAQGSSERNISVIISQDDSTRALRAAHAGFYLSDQTLSIGIVGGGLIGGTFLKQLALQLADLKSRFKIDARVRAIANSKRMLLSDAPIPLADWKARLESSGSPIDLERFTSHVKADHLPHAVVIDCTASEEIAAFYPNWLGRGIHVITPNKKANSGRLEYYRKLRELSRERQARYLYRATVGAGLPVISTLKDLIQTGDEVIRIEGVLSGTLSFLFNSFAAGSAFSAIVRKARELGYTEPDPRDDLSGRDVARKLVILAREMGLELELGEISVQSLVPPALAGGMTPDEFLDRLPEHDGAMTELKTAAEKSGEVLRYVGVIDPKGKSAVELKRYPASHPFARISGSDNIIAFQTARYCKQPLIVQGPGAGPEVTAGGVFADLLRLSSSLGALS